MATKQEAASLNGAYYGPPIPPQRSYRSVGRSSDCGCCLLCTVFKFILSIVITVGIIILVLWLIFRPNEIKAYVDDAHLSQFNLTGNTSIHYNLTVDMSIRNPNKRIGIYYDYIEARVIYDDNRLGFTPVQPFYQGKKTTSELHPAFQGSQVVLGGAADTFRREKGEGNFYVDIDLRMKVRLKIWIFKIRRVRPKIDCTIKLPVPGNAGAAKFERTKCDVHLF